MREIHIDQITEVVKNICIDANINLPQDVLECIKTNEKKERNKRGQMILSQLVKNAELAKVNRDPICQDTGMAVFFVSIGQEVHIVGGSITDAIEEGVRQGYKEGYLRKSVVKSPIKRINTEDNTPAIVHYDIIKGDKIYIEFGPKGFGSENMSKLKMLKPSDGIEGIINFVVETVMNSL